MARLPQSHDSPAAPSKETVGTCCGSLWPCMQTPLPSGIVDCNWVTVALSVRNNIQKSIPLGVFNKAFSLLLTISCLVFLHSFCPQMESCSHTLLINKSSHSQSHEWFMKQFQVYFSSLSYCLLWCKGEALHWDCTVFQIICKNKDAVQY